MLPSSFSAAPEGGWGWVVVFASFFAHVIVLGLQYSFGVLYRALLADPSLGVGGDRGVTAWTGSINVCCMLFSGVFIGHFVQAYGHRRVALVGSLLVPLGLATSAAVTSLYWLYLTYGVITGVGFAASFQPSVMIISRYFVKRRALATGIAVGGSGVGTLLFAAVSDAAINRLGWKTTLLAFAAVSFVVLLLAAVTYVPVHSSPIASAAPPLSPEGKAVDSDATTGNAASDSALATGSSSNVAGGGSAVVGQTPDGQDHGQGHGPGASAAATTAAQVEVKVEPAQTEAAGSSNAAAGSTASAAAPVPAVPQAHQHPPLTMGGVWMHPAFRPVGALLCVYGGCIFAVYGHLVVAAGDGGLPRDDAARLVSWVGMAGMCGRIAFGRLQDGKVMDRVTLLQLTLALAGLAVFGMAFLGPGAPAWQGGVSYRPNGSKDEGTSLTGLSSDGRVGLWVLFAVGFGAFSGGVVSQVPPLMVEYLGLENLPKTMGAQYTVQAPAVLLGPPSGGWARAAAGNYFGTLLFIGLAMVLAPMFLVLMPRHPSHGHSAVDEKPAGGHDAAGSTGVAMLGPAAAEGPLPAQGAHPAGKAEPATIPADDER